MNERVIDLRRNPGYVRLEEKVLKAQKDNMMKKEKVKNIKIIDPPKPPDLKIDDFMYQHFTTKGNPQPMDCIDEKDPRNYRWTSTPYEVATAMFKIVKARDQLTVDKMDEMIAMLDSDALIDADDFEKIFLEEMAICRQEGTPTSRLTSLYMKLKGK